MSLQTKINSLARDLGPWQPPVMLDLSDKVDTVYAEKLIDNNEVEHIIDKVGCLALDLYSMRKVLDGLEVDQQDYIQEVESKGLGFGKWFYFPWDKSFVRYLDRDDHRDLRTFRNKNLISRTEQEVLYAARVAVFGLSVGSSVVESLAMSGIGGTLILGDFDALELSNTNRLNSYVESVGSEKIDIAAKKISKIDPYIYQVHLPQGLDDDFEKSGVEYDMMFDEVDDLSAKFKMRDLSKRSEKPLIMVTDAGDRAIIDIERYDTEPKTEMFLGKIKEECLHGIVDESLSDSEKKAIIARFVGIKNISGRLIKSVMLIGEELGGIPQLFTTANIGGSLGAIAAREIILGRDIKSGRYVSNFRKTFKLGSPDGVLSDLSSFYAFLKK